MASSRDELAHNAARWAAVCNRELPKDVGHVFIFFPREGGPSVVCSNVDKSRVKKELKDILRQLESLIINPYEN